MTTYIVIDIDTQTKLIDFSQINTTSAQTMRRNLANTQAMLSYQVTPSFITNGTVCLLYTSPSPRDRQKSRMPSSA